MEAVIRQITRAAHSCGADSFGTVLVRYANGLGANHDYKEAVKWFRKAAKQ